MFTGTLNFKPDEPNVACNCGCGMLPEADFMERVQTLRNNVGFALPVTSAARCPDYNEKVASTGRNGPHTTGRAIDIAVTGARAYLVLACAIRLGFTGIGVAKGFIHLDDLKADERYVRPAVWTY